MSTSSHVGLLIEPRSCDPEVTTTGPLANSAKDILEEPPRSDTGQQGDPLAWLALCIAVLIVADAMLILHDLVRAINA